MWPSDEQSSCSRNGHMVGSRFIHPISNELPQTQRVRHTPRNPSFAVYALEKAQQHQPKIHSRSQRWPTVLLGIKFSTLLFTKRIELGCLQCPVQLLIEGVSWGF